jgi:ankyrin repeat protein
MPESSSLKTPLHLAAYRGHLEIIKLFLDINQIDFNVPD